MYYLCIFVLFFLFLYKVVCFYNQENLNENLQFLTILLRIVAVYGNKRPNNYAKKWKTVIQDLFCIFHFSKYSIENDLCSSDLSCVI